MSAVSKGLPRIEQAVRVLRWTPWFVLVGVIVTAANLLIGNHINVTFWLASWAAPGLALDLARMLAGGRPVWSRKQVITWRGLGAVLIFLAVAGLLETPLDNLGGYHNSLATSAVNTDWSQFSDVVAVTVALLIARQFLQWTKPSAEATAVK